MAMLHQPPYKNSNQYFELHRAFWTAGTELGTEDGLRILLLEPFSPEFGKRLCWSPGKLQGWAAQRLSGDSQPSADV